MKIYFLTTVTSSDYKSWSNIPYLLHRNLEKRGHVVKNVVIKEISFLKNLFNVPVRILRKIFNLKTEYFYVRTPVHYFVANLYSKYVEIVSKPNDIMLVQGFSYPLRNKKNKMILIGDWPSSYLFEHFLRRPPGLLEGRSIKREDDVIESADMVITLFPSVYDFMHKRYKNNKIKYLGNVVNIDENVKVTSDIVHQKRASKRLLFIGQPFYLTGAIELIEAVSRLVVDGYDLTVDIVGISKELLPYKHDWLFVHGYLDKGVKEDKRKYYELLSDSRLYVNSTSGWNGFQATLEAMYFYNPIVVHRNVNISQMFPNLNSFSYDIDSEGGCLENAIRESFLDCDSYLQKCHLAHEAAALHTWENFVVKLEATMNE